MKLSLPLVRPRTRSLRARQISGSVVRSNVEIASSTQTTQDNSQALERRRQHSPKKRIFSGIQPTGIPHLGNYLGALRRWKQLQDEKTAAKSPKNHQLLFAIADLHALTGNQDPGHFLEQRLKSYASLLAIGLDPKESILFMQSAVPSHTQLMWIFSTIASTGYLSRMTQWKSKLGLSDSASLSDKVTTEKLKLGLFSYPVLQAADILLYRPDYVPVGEDQAQHVEFTRTLARSFNAHYCAKTEQFFSAPKLLLSPAKRVMSLKEPDKKMSKSHDDAMSRILITDNEEEIGKKIKSALTDSIQGISYDPVTRPGVSNLIEILKHTSCPDQTCEEIAIDNANVSMRAFKELVARSIVDEMQGIGDRFEELLNPSDPALGDALHSGNTKARSIAGHTMSLINGILGLGDAPQSSNRAPKSSSRALKQKVIQEQIEEEKLGFDEPDVLPQKSEGVDRPIAS